MKSIDFSENYFYNSAFWSSCLCYISAGSIGRTNYKYGYQMYTALNEPFDCVVGESNLKSTWGFIANQNVLKDFNSTGNLMLIHFIDLESKWGGVVKTLLNGGDFIETDQLRNKSEYRISLPQSYQELTNREIAVCIEVFLTNLFSADIIEIPAIRDSRIERVLNYVGNNLNKKIRLEEAAELIHLSPERFRHLFIEEVGMPFSKYVLWKRIRLVTEIVNQKNMAVSKVCTQVGFTDYSHYSRVFKQIFGVAPLKLYEDCKVVSQI